MAQEEWGESLFSDEKPSSNLSKNKQQKKIDLLKRSKNTKIAKGSKKTEHIKDSTQTEPSEDSKQPKKPKKAINSQKSKRMDENGASKDNRSRPDSKAWKKQKRKFERTKTRVKVIGVLIVLFIIIAVVLGYVYFYHVDTDGDGILDVIDDDDDNDGMSDDWEEHYGLNPKDPGDAKKDKDNDGLKNKEELDFKSNPEKSDTDGDQLNDYDECKIHGTIPFERDSDSDGMPDGWEVKYALEPLSDDADLDIDMDGYDANLDGLVSENEFYTNLEEYLNDTNPKLNDTDIDGMSDGWEIHFRQKTRLLKRDIQKYNPPGKREYNYTFDPSDPTDANEDIDVDATRTHTGDGLTNLMEFIYSTDPTRPDSDGDNLTDFEEVTRYNTDPIKPDTDNDKLWDGWEIEFGGIAVGLDPNTNDSDGDGLLDTFEDLDNDTYLTSFLYNLVEFNLGTSPISNDTDKDGLTDGWEDYFGLDPLKNNGENDDDGDLLSNHAEFENQTEPDNSDTDGDGLTDGDELIFGYPGVLINGVYTTETDLPHYFTNPLDNDTDMDGISDGEEVIKGEDGYITNATDDDTDGDEILDLEELETGDDGFKTNPTDEDTDGDLLTDKYEIDAFWGYIPTYKTIPTKADTDDDGLLDGEEVLTDFLPFKDGINGTDPTKNDTDQDGMEDGWEATFGFADRNLLETLIKNYDQRYKRTNYYLKLKNDNSIPGIWLVNPLDPNDANEDPDFDGYDFDNNRVINTAEEFINTKEFKHRTNPLAWDTDLDRMSDSWEAMNTLEPLTNDADLDKDDDGITYYINSIPYEDSFTNLEEFLIGTDSNGDGIIDHNSTDPTNWDTDGDFESDYHEIWFGDDDGDGLVNGWELIFNGTPLDVDGYIPNNPMPGYFDPTKPDSDGDGTNDSDENYDGDYAVNIHEQFTQGPYDINDIEEPPGCSDPTDESMTPNSIKTLATRSSVNYSQKGKSYYNFDLKMKPIRVQVQIPISIPLSLLLAESILILTLSKSYLKQYYKYS